MFKVIVLFGLLVLCSAFLGASGRNLRFRQANIPATVFSPPGKFMLALGDSLAFGFQEARLNSLLANNSYSPDAFDTGYNDILFQLLQQNTTDIELVNLGCPGVTALQFEGNGTCPFPLPLKVNYTGSQLLAALDFLQNHAGQVSPITISLGSNDVLQLARSCNLSATCIINNAQSELQASLNNIFKQLREAAPDTEIVYLLPYNIFEATPLGAASDTLYFALIDVVRRVAEQYAIVIADVFPEFNRGPNGIHTLCQMTYLCEPGNTEDIHPTNFGYQTIAEVMANVSGYLNLQPFCASKFDAIPGLASCFDVRQGCVPYNTTTHHCAQVEQSFTVPSWSTQLCAISDRSCDFLNLGVGPTCYSPTFYNCTSNESALGAALCPISTIIGAAPNSCQVDHSFNAHALDYSLEAKLVTQACYSSVNYTCCHHWTSVTNNVQLTGNYTERLVPANQTTTACPTSVSEFPIPVPTSSPIPSLA